MYPDSCHSLTVVSNQSLRLTAAMQLTYDNEYSWSPLVQEFQERTHGFRRSVKGLNILQGYNQQLNRPLKPSVVSTCLQTLMTAATRLSHRKLTDALFEWLGVGSNEAITVDGAWMTK